MSRRARTATLWIFGYGSLVWRPAFPHVERRPGCVDGWHRRFWQGSTDHRGRPDAPGRVVTILPSADATCWGMAYRVAAEDREEVLAGLDHRERGGFDRRDVTVRFHDSNAQPVSAIVYVATPENPNYLGEAPLPAIVAQIRRSHGPSGANIEYAEKLAAALREMGAEDEHVFAIANHLAALRSR